MVKATPLLSDEILELNERTVDLGILKACDEEAKAQLGNDDRRVGGDMKGPHGAVSM